MKINKNIALIFLLLFLIQNTYASDLKFGIYTSDKASVMYKQFKPIIQYLEKDAKKQGLELKISIKIYPSYESALEGIVRGDYDFARFGPASYILAKQKNSDIKLLVKEEQKGKEVFNGIFIVKKDSPIKSLKDLKNKSFAFGDKHSTIGRYLAQNELLKANITSKDLKAFDYLNRHDKVALAVAFGNYDAGVVKESSYNKYKSRGLKAISSFQNITKPWLVRSGLDDKIYNTLKKSLLDLKDEKVLKSIKKTAFIESRDEDYTIIKKSIENSSKF
ncbi:phosphate/phosphite/phosphonate ABC transporter substrate-binding protein [Poseidonibacter lekithochrous]|uniref:phosphate/phosphite/phosphonate ABC transporter substrate-binding protein n=1 Tax=Poseidonibacter TaxID=2321187 RepID=UPI001C0942D3|nr:MULTISPECIES: phosphate/phosphite/phosphonate ABC transporter substrate-binding protein [Poseidonibacter]MBU3013123.1 phosphate/phosphite/phosphonate ABC transporter substrate-binding protein [Poseidonibacter lekithochrous]MDO6826419.1 phosphate/phosphite/phosphonate ABC transporter substrate-binding protein [Poseidonibacter sp. 1_MG-2023]